jgi:glutamine amidotransferase PdxT
VIEQGSLLAAAFHPELAGDGRLHERMLERT